MALTFEEKNGFLNVTGIRRRRNEPRFLGNTPPNFRLRFRKLSLFRFVRGKVTKEFRKYRIQRCLALAVLPPQTRYGLAIDRAHNSLQKKAHYADNIR